MKEVKFTVVDDFEGKGFLNKHGRPSCRVAFGESTSIFVQRVYSFRQYSALVLSMRLYSLVS